MPKNKRKQKIGDCMQNKVKYVKKVYRFRIFCKKCEFYMHKLTEMNDNGFKIHIYECIGCKDQLEIINLKSNES